MTTLKKTASMPGRASVAAALVLVAVGVSLALGGATRANEATLPQTASSLWRGDGVVHARFVDDEGKLHSEEWLDQQTGATRKVEYDYAPRVTVERVTVRNGTTVTTWTSLTPSKRFVYEAVDAGDQRLLYTSYLLRPSRMFDLRTARVEGAGLLAGLATWKVVRNSPSRDVAGVYTTTMEVDQKTFLPLRYVAEAGGEKASLTVTSERLARTAQTSQLFTVPDGSWTYRDKRIRLGDLTGAVPFTVYGLGASYRGLTAEAPNLQEQKVETAQGFPIEPELFLSYSTTGSGIPQIQLQEHAAGTPDAQFRLSKYRSQGTARTAVILGAERTVYLLDADQPAVYFAVVVNDTLVKGRAAMPAAETLAMLASLREQR